MKKQNKVITWIAGMIGIVVLVILDQYTKLLAVTHLKDQPDIPILKDIFELSYVENRGAAFGMLQNKQLLFVILTLVVMVVLMDIYRRMPDTKRYLPCRITILFLEAGAIGNLVDRVSQGYVVDFFYFKLIDFPVFNVADIYVTVSVFVLAILLLFFYKEEELDQILFHKENDFDKKSKVGK